MTLLRLRWLLFGLASFFGGCGSPSSSMGFDGSTTSDGSVSTDSSIGSDGSIGFDASTDASVGDAGIALADASYFGTGLLQLQSIDPTQAIELVPGQALRITARLLGSDGFPAVGQRIDFALIGATGGSTLIDLFGFTDANGLVTIHAQAGYDATTFQVRISADSMSLYLPITVKAVPLTDLPVELDPSAAAFVTSATVQAFAGVTCEGFAGVPPSASATFGSSGSAELASLATTIDYAVVVNATLSGGAEVQQCIDGIVPGSTPVPAFDLGLVDPPATP